MSAGFGGALTDSSAYLLATGLPPNRREQALQQLFSAKRGIGLTFIRAPMGASDFTVGPAYTYDDVPAGVSDPQLAHFSIAHDMTYIVPLLREARRINPALTVMANPWSPPAWMKTNDSLVGSGDPRGTLKHDAYAPLADYFVRFVQAYRRAGVKISYVGVQNEPLIAPSDYPGMVLTPEAEGVFIGRFLAPAFQRANIQAKILAWDFDFAFADQYVPSVASIAGTSLGGVAYHCYFGGPKAAPVTMRIRRLPSFVTECSSGLSHLRPGEMIVRALRGSMAGVQLWNLALNEAGGPKHGGGCPGCIAPLVVDASKRTYRLTSDYWELGQFSKFIQHGAYRIASSSDDGCGTQVACGIETVAFRNPDGTEVLVVTTNNGRAAAFTVTEGERHFTARVPDGGIATFVWRTARSDGASVGR